MGLDSLVEVLKKIKSKHASFSKRLDEAEALSHWEQVVGPLISKHTRTVRVEKGVLWVEVDHSIWKTELHHRKHQILERLNAQVEKTKPKEILADLLFLDKRY